MKNGNLEMERQKGSRFSILGIQDEKMEDEELARNNTIPQMEVDHMGLSVAWDSG